MKRIIIITALILICLSSEILATEVIVENLGGTNTFTFNSVGDGAWRNITLFKMGRDWQNLRCSGTLSIAHQSIGAVSSTYNFSWTGSSFYSSPAIQAGTAGSTSYAIPVVYFDYLVPVLSKNYVPNAYNQMWVTNVQRLSDGYLYLVLSHASRIAPRLHNVYANTWTCQSFQYRYYRDADNDGYGNPAINIIAPSKPAGYADDNTDCDDTNANKHPGNTEICGNAIDENCDGKDDVCPIIPPPVIPPPVLPPSTNGIPCVMRTGSCNTGESPILHLSSSSNAHAEIISQNNYNNVFCCPTIKTTASGTEFIRLSANTNAHVEYGPTKIYPIQIYTDSTYCRTSNVCNDNELCVVSTTSGTTNLHAGQCGSYQNNICCANCISSNVGQSCTAQIIYAGQTYNCPGTKDNNCNCMDNFNDDCPLPSPNCLNQPCVQGNSCHGVMDALCNCIDINGDNCPVTPDNITCGNNHREPDLGEECDRFDLGSTKCSDTSKKFGSIKCNQNCKYIGCYSECKSSVSGPYSSKCLDMCGSNGYNTFDGSSFGSICFKDSNCMFPCAEKVNVTINSPNIVTQKKIVIYNGKPVVVNIYTWN